MYESHDGSGRGKGSQSVKRIVEKKVQNVEICVVKNDRIKYNVFKETTKSGKADFARLFFYVRLAAHVSIKEEQVW